MLAPEAVKVVRGALESLLSGWGSTPPFPGQRKDLRMLKVPLGVGSVLEEPAPNAANNTNSATMVLYQVGMIAGLRVWFCLCACRRTAGIQFCCACASVWSSQGGRRRGVGARISAMAACRCAPAPSGFGYPQLLRACMHAGTPVCLCA